MPSPASATCPAAIPPPLLHLRPDVPGVLALVAIYYLLSRLDLLNTFTGLVLAYSGDHQLRHLGLQGLPGEPQPEPRGGGHGGRGHEVAGLHRILLPLSAPMFVFIFLLQFVGTYSEFVLANLVLTGVESWNVGVGLRSFTTGQFQTKWGSSPRRASWDPCPSSSSSTGSSNTSSPATPRGP